MTVIATNHPDEEAQHTDSCCVDLPSPGDCCFGDYDHVLVHTIVVCTAGVHIALGQEHTLERPWDVHIALSVLAEQGLCTLHGLGPCWQRSVAQLRVLHVVLPFHFLRLKVRQREIESLHYLQGE